MMLRVIISAAVAVQLLFITTPAFCDLLNVEKMRDSVLAAKAVEGTKVGDHTLFDQDGVSFSLHDYFRGGKPLIISYIYTNCPHVCPTITASFKEAVIKAVQMTGGQFNVLSIGFDAPLDTPESLREYGLRFTEDFAFLRFASGDPATIKRLTSELGFFFKRKDDGSFDHMDMVTVLYPDGTVYKQVFNLREQGDKVVKRLRELILGEVPDEAPITLVDWVKYFCSRYDPYTDTYVTDMPVLFIFIINGIVITSIVLLVWGDRIKVRVLRVIRPGRDKDRRDNGPNENKESS